MNAPVLLSSPQYDTFAYDLATLIGGEIGRIDRRHFPDGELYQRIEIDVHERSVVIVGGTTDDHSTLMLYDLACAAVKYGARRLDICIPYFGYSTMERATQPGEVVTAKTRARLFSAIPQAARGNHVHLFDLHSDGLPHYFEGSVATQHLSSRALWVERLQSINQGDFVLASTDAGRAKQVEALANELRVDAALIIKRRLSGSETEVVGVNAHVEDRVVVIYDDMVRTGGSLVQAAQAYRAAGARDVYATCTHGVFPEGAWERLQESRVFTRVITTNSHPRASSFQADDLEIISVVPLFADALREVFK